MALVVLITAILISALVVKVGTVALTMTGLDRLAWIAVKRRSSLSRLSLTPVGRRVRPS
jgi:hypothetical protein